LLATACGIFSGKIFPSWHLLATDVIKIKLNTLLLKGLLRLYKVTRWKFMCRVIKIKKLVHFDQNNRKSGVAPPNFFIVLKS
jgi:hypothetical protein